MKRRTIPYGRISRYAAGLLVAALATGAACAVGYWAVLIVTLPLAVWSLGRLYRLYGEIVRRLMFIFNAVQNDDYTFRFAEQAAVTDSALVNYSLNRIKEVLDHTKMQIREKEKYFELITECADIGILTVDERGCIAQSNLKARRLLNVPHLGHIDQLRPRSEELREALAAIRAGEQRTVRLATELGEMNLLLSCARMHFDAHELRVVSVSDIRDELDTKEAESWERITRILTHEIMNSLAPVTSISHTLLASPAEGETLRLGLQTIHATSDRLLHFVDAFRQVTRIPTPQKRPFYLSELVSEILSLVDCSGIGIEVALEPADTLLFADRNLMSQVLLNLLKNAVEALAESSGERRIAIRSSIDEAERIRIEITDSGDAIPAEVAENIFTPFFTTKPDGSGIGLAVSRQIVRLHGGTLHLKQNTTGKVTFAVVLE